MKTTIELPDDLARTVKELAAREGLTMRSFVEEALRREVVRHEERPVWKPDPSCSYGTGWLTPEAQKLTWAEIIELSYER